MPGKYLNIKKEMMSFSCSKTTEENLSWLSQVLYFLPYTAKGSRYLSLACRSDQISSSFLSLAISSMPTMMKTSVSPLISLNVILLFLTSYRTSPLADLRENLMKMNSKHSNPRNTASYLNSFPLKQGLLNSAAEILPDSFFIPTSNILVHDPIIFYPDYHNSLQMGSLFKITHTSTWVLLPFWIITLFSSALILLIV